MRWRLVHPDAPDALQADTGRQVVRDGNPTGNRRRPHAASRQGPAPADSPTG